MSTETIRRARWEASGGPSSSSTKKDVDGAVRTLRAVLSTTEQVHAHPTWGGVHGREKAGAALAAFAEAHGERPEAPRGAGVPRVCLHEKLGRFEEAIDAGERAMKCATPTTTRLHLLGPRPSEGKARRRSQGPYMERSKGPSVPRKISAGRRAMLTARRRGPHTGRASEPDS